MCRNFLNQILLHETRFLPEEDCVDRVLRDWADLLVQMRQDHDGSVNNAANPDVPTTRQVNDAR